jgi:hypothetical protein
MEAGAREIPGDENPYSAADLMKIHMEFQREPVATGPWKETT